MSFTNKTLSLEDRLDGSSTAKECIHNLLHTSIEEYFYGYENDLERLLEYAPFKKAAIKGFLPIYFLGKANIYRPYIVEKTPVEIYELLLKPIIASEFAYKDLLCNFSAFQKILSENYGGINEKNSPFEFMCPEKNRSINIAVKGIYNMLPCDLRKTFLAKVAKTVFHNLYLYHFGNILGFDTLPEYKTPNAVGYLLAQNNKTLLNYYFDYDSLFFYQKVQHSCCVFSEIVYHHRRNEAFTMSYKQFFYYMKNTLPEECNLYQADIINDTCSLTNEKYNYCLQTNLPLNILIFSLYEDYRASGNNTSGSLLIRLAYSISYMLSMYREYIFDLNNTDYNYTNYANN